MPKDYSHCKVVGNEKPATEKNCLENMSIITGRKIENDKIAGSLSINTYSMVTIAVTPGITYTLNVTSNGTNKLYETDVSNNNGSATLSTLTTLENGTHDITITPTKNLLLANYEIDDTSYVSINSIISENNYNEIDLSNNITMIYDRYIGYNTNKVIYSTGYPGYTIKVVPGKTYYLMIRSDVPTSRTFCMSRR
jgi:hypothetical protein